jgi:HPr kinase/phosphorylase
MPGGTQTPPVHGRTPVTVGRLMAELGFPALVPADDAGVSPGDAGFYHPSLPIALQVIDSAAEAARASSVSLWPQKTPRCAIVAAGVDAEPWRRLCAAQGIGCYRSELPATQALERLRSALARQAPGLTLHGTLVAVRGLGVLLLGRSASGKSELALELVARGHCLVADDAVELQQAAPGCLVGGCADASCFGFIELRGLGIVDLRATYGATSVCARSRVDLAVRLGEGMPPLTPEERLYGRRRPLSLLDSEVPEIMLPAHLGHNAIMVDTACRDLRLRLGGYCAAEVFAAAQTRRAAGVTAAGAAAGAAGEAPK